MIKASLVLLVACGVIPLLRRRSAAERHALWTASLATATLLPVLTRLMPAWEPAWAQRAAATWPGVFRSGTPIEAGDIVVRAARIEPGSSDVLAILSVVWVVTSVVLLAGLAVQATRVRRLVWSGTPAGARHAAIAHDVAVRLGVSAPRLTTSERITMPLAWGIRRAHVLLPRAAHEWPDERVWAVCAHEMAHISRGDWLAHLLAEAACRTHWFNPLFWIARNRLSRDSERAADDVVLRLGATGADYASHLIEIARAAQPAEGLASTVAMARASGLERRVAALLSELVNRARVSRRRAAVIAAGAGVIAGPLAALSAPIPSVIEIRLSNLPPLDDTARREFVGDGGEAVRDLRVLSPMAGDVAPAIVEYTPPPLYSDAARRAGVEGVVTVRAHIDEAGRMSASRVIAGPGAGLEQNALVALRQWRLRPGTRHGVATPMDVEIAIGFTLRSEWINAQIANDMVSLIGPGVTPPQAVRLVNPQPPARGPFGTVVLDVVLLEDGRPRIVRILRSVGAEADESAVRAFEQWRFSPALQDGRPIKVRMNAEVRLHG